MRKEESYFRGGRRDMGMATRDGTTTRMTMLMMRKRNISGRIGRTTEVGICR
jgi:hypothetical protein